MDNSGIIRSIKIDLLLDNHNPIIEYYNNICESLVCVDLNVYHLDGSEQLYYINGTCEKEWVFYYDSTYGVFYCSPNHFLKALQNKFNISQTSACFEITKLILWNFTNSGLIRNKQIVVVSNDKCKLYSAITALSNGHNLQISGSFMSNTLQHKLRDAQ